MTTMKDGTHVLGMWMLFDHGHKDWFCQIQRTEGGPWRMTWRFRYYVDDKIHGSSDEKRHFGLDFKPGLPKAVMIEAAKSMQETLRMAGFGKEPYDLLIDSSDPDVIMARVATCPHLHSAKVESPEDAEKLGYTELAEQWRKTGKPPVVEG